MNNADYILFSGAAPGAEAEFGACAERHGIEEVNFTFEGHTEARRRGIRVLNHEELQSGDVSLEYVSKLMHRRYTDSPTLRKILQTLWYQVNSGQEIYVVGVILDDGTVRGRDGLGRGVREAVQQAALRVRSGEGRLVLLDRRGLEGAGRPGDHAPALHRHRHPEHQRERQEGDSKRCSPSRSADPLRRLVRPLPAPLRPSFPGISGAPCRSGHWPDHYACFGCRESVW